MLGSWGLGSGSGLGGPVPRLKHQNLQNTESKSNWPIVGCDSGNDSGNFFPEFSRIQNHNLEVQIQSPAKINKISI